jgi:3-hydroxyisobutyrate dehydrogenase-like beta-hydroxyacid dehydrogenase
MTEPQSIAFLGFGEAARAFAASLKAARPGLALSAHDIKLHGAASSAMRRAMAEAGVVCHETAAGLAGADWIISAVTADQSLAALAPLLPALSSGLVVDINSVSPDRKRHSAAQVEARGAGYLDMAVMAPVHPDGHATPVLVAGDRAEALLPVLEAMGFVAGLAGGAPGAATAIKMVRSVFVKGLEAITVECLLAAGASDCLDTVLASLSKSYPGLGWPDFAAYQFERTLTHGIRRAAEMEESGATLDALGLEGGLARAIATVQRRMGAAGATPDAALAATVAAALGARRARDPSEG